MMCLNNETWSLQCLSFNIQNSAEIIKVILSTNTHVVAIDRYIRWNFLNHSCVILNVDGSCLGTPQRAGFGGLLCNSAGVCVSGFSGFINNSTYILLAELTAIYHGLILVWDLGIDEFVCHSDSLQCISLITRIIVNFHVYATLIQDIRDLIRTSNVSLHHTLREGN
jgi:ribonuclease HI